VDPAASFEAFWGVASDGRSVEVHAVRAVSGTTLDALTSTAETLVCTGVLTGQSLSEMPLRLTQISQSLYGGDVRFAELSAPAALAETGADLTLSGTAHGVGTMAAADLTIGAGASLPPGTPSLWYDGSDIDGDGSNNALWTDGDPVGEWVDKGSLGYDVTQATAGLKPTYRATGGYGSTPTLEFDGDDWLQSAGSHTAASQPLTYAAAVEVPSGTATLSLGGLSTAVRWYMTTTFWTIRSTTTVVTDLARGTGWHAISARFDGASSWARRSGTQSTSGNAGTTGRSTAAFSVGSNGTTLNPWNGKITEWLCYDGSEDPAGIEAYFTAKGIAP
jgi:hypothetical protein